jgi:hypothetical protein
LTGLHETQAIDKFSYGLSDRGASIRLPVNFIKNGYKGESNNFLLYRIIGVELLVQLTQTYQK